LDDAQKEPIKLNLGCGLNTPPEWINIDASFTAKVSKWGGLYKILCRLLRIQPVPWPKNIKTCDVRGGIPFSDNIVQVIFTSHMLEHITYEDARFVIRECHRCLYKGG
jgi:predicted SAM-dependent methyltransferase